MQPAIVITRATKLKNLALAGGLVAFVGGVYQYTYSKMKTVRRFCQTIKREVPACIGIFTRVFDYLDYPISAAE